MNEVVTGERPFSLTNQWLVANTVVNAGRPPSIDRKHAEETGDALMNDLANLVSGCWAHVPKDRPSADFVLSTLTRLLSELGDDPRPLTDPKYEPPDTVPLSKESTATDGGRWTKPSDRVDDSVSSIERTADLFSGALNLTKKGKYRMLKRSDYMTTACL